MLDTEFSTLQKEVETANVAIDLTHRGTSAIGNRVSALEVRASQGTQFQEHMKAKVVEPEGKLNHPTAAPQAAWQPPGLVGQTGGAVASAESSK